MEKMVNILGNDLWVKEIIVQDNPQAPTLIFLHDALGCISLWQNFPQHLCEVLQLNGIIYDRAGHGKSEALKHERKADFFEREAWKILPALLQYLNIEHKILIGHSDGATIALLYASRFPSIQALVAIAGHIFVEEITRVGVHSQMQLFAKPAIFERLERYHGNKTQALLDSWSSIWLSAAFKTWNISNQLSSIIVPTLVLQGSLDEYATLDHSRKIAQAIGHSATFSIIQDARHFPHKEHPETTIRHIHQFLQPLL